MAKQIYGYESEFGYLYYGDGHGQGLQKRSSPKRTRGGRVQARKRKMVKASPKSNKEMKG